MDTFLNIALLAVGLGGALTAFVGDTIEKGTQDKRRRITTVGWLSLSLLLVAFALGVVREARTRVANERRAREAVVAEEARQEAEKQLRIVSAQLSTVSSKFAEAQRQLQQVTRDLPTERDEGYIDLAKHPSLTPRSGRTGDDLAVYAGDEFVYYSFCPAGLVLQSSPARGLALLVGDRLYPLEKESGSVRIAGPVGRRLEAEIINPFGERCHLKYYVRSTDRTRGRR